jgi:biopolymer transport protein ExbB
MTATSRILSTTALIAVLAVPAVGAGAEDAAPAEGTLDQAAAGARRDLERALETLSDLRETIAAEKVPLTRKLSSSENRLVDVRSEFDDVSRTLDTRNLDLNNLRGEIDARRQESTYLSNLLDEYVRQLETRVHVTELQRYGEQFEAARLAPENSAATPAEVFGIQTAVVETSLDRLLELVGGTSFPGKAVGEDGLVREVDFALFGPVALYATRDGSGAGLAEQRLGSLEPNMVLLDEPRLTADARAVVTTGTGLIPFDPTLGNAQKIEETQDSWTEHLQKGGTVMIPILLLAVLAVIVILIKAAQLLRVPKPPKRLVNDLLDAVKQRDFEVAMKRAQRISGPIGEMLRAGVEHAREPKVLVEEVMYERTLETRLNLQRFLSFLAICAASAPLLGLLGTVTGIINTFELITVFGTGDPKTLSGGISEALITTKFGLIVAIPALLMHALLSRMAKRYIDGMEKTAVRLLNRIVPGSSNELPQEDAETGREREAAAGVPVAGLPPVGAITVADGPDH